MTMPIPWGRRSEPEYHHKDCPAIWNVACPSCRKDGDIDPFCMVCDGVGVPEGECDCALHPDEARERYDTL